MEKRPYPYGRFLLLVRDSQAPRGAIRAGSLVLGATVGCRLAGGAGAVGGEEGENSYLTTLLAM